MDQTEMRRANAGHAVALLYQESPRTMSALEAESSVSRRTLELILEELTALGWVEELVPSVGQRRPGRPARQYAFRYDGGYLMAIQLDASDVRASVADLSGAVLGSYEITLPITTSRVDRLRALEDCVRYLLDSVAIAASAVLAVTVSTPGAVHDDGTVDLPFTMPEWRGFSLSSAVGRLFTCAVRVENDAKLAALGEKWSREGAARDFGYVFSDSNRIGVALVLNGELRRGVDGAAGEVPWSSERDFYPGSPVLEGLDDPAHADHSRAQNLVGQIRAGEPSAVRELERLAELLAPRVLAIGWLVAPEEIILGGTLATIGELLVPPLRERLRRLEPMFCTPITWSRSGAQAILLGSLRMCIESLHTQMEDLTRNPSKANVRAAPVRTPRSPDRSLVAHQLVSDRSS